MKSKYINTINKFRFHSVEGNVKKLALKDVDRVFEFIDENLSENEANKVYNKILKMVKRQVDV